MTSCREKIVFKQGDLVYLPSHTSLYTFDEIAEENMAKGNTLIFKYTKLLEPTVAILVGVSSYGFCKIIWKGQQYSVGEQDIYPMKEENKNVDGSL